MTDERLLEEADKTKSLSVQNTQIRDSKKRRYTNENEGKQEREIEEEEEEDDDEYKPDDSDEEEEEELDIDWTKPDAWDTWRAHFIPDPPKEKVNLVEALLKHGGYVKQSNGEWIQQCWLKAK